MKVLEATVKGGRSMEVASSVPSFFCYYPQLQRKAQALRRSGEHAAAVAFMVKCERSLVENNTASLVADADPLGGASCAQAIDLCDGSGAEDSQSWAWQVRLDTARLDMHPHDSASIEQAPERVKKRWKPNETMRRRSGGGEAAFALSSSSSSSASASVSASASASVSASASASSSSSSSPAVERSALRGTLMVRVKDQTGEETVFKVKKTTKMGKVFEAYARRKGLQLSSLRFLLDGERIGNEESPKSVRVRRGGRAGGSRRRSVLLGKESACSPPPPPPFVLGAALPRSVRSSSSRAPLTLSLSLALSRPSSPPPPPLALQLELDDQDQIDCLLEHQGSVSVSSSGAASAQNSAKSGWDRFASACPPPHRLFAEWTAHVSRVIKPGAPYFHCAATGETTWAPLDLDAEWKLGRDPARLSLIDHRSCVTRPGVGVAGVAIAAPLYEPIRPTVRLHSSPPPRGRSARRSPSPPALALNSHPSPRSRFSPSPAHLGRGVRRLL